MSSLAMPQSSRSATTACVASDRSARARELPLGTCSNARNHRCWSASIVNHEFSITFLETLADDRHEKLHGPPLGRRST